MTNKRMSRVDAEIQKSLAEIISKFDDVNITGTLVSIMKVDTTSDFSLAKVYVSVLGDENQIRETYEGLKSAASFLRTQLAKTINLRNTPELIFIMDQSIEYGVNMSKLIDDVNAKDHKDEDNNVE